MFLAVDRSIVEPFSRVRVTNLPDRFDAPESPRSFEYSRHTIVLATCASERLKATVSKTGEPDGTDYRYQVQRHSRRHQQRRHDFRLDGNDTIVAGDGNDTIFAGKGSDFISGGDGVDTLYYGASKGSERQPQATHVGHGGYAEAAT
jgi:hypothetical protein